MVGYTYDAAGRRTLMTASRQTAIEYAYDNAGRLTDVHQGSDVVHITYDDLDRYSTVTLRNGVVTTYVYDAAGQLSSMSYIGPSGPIGDLAYSYDANGRVVRQSGSMARVDLPAAVAGNVYNAHNQLVSWNGLAYTYDLNGNLASDGTRSFSWNARDRLGQIQAGGSAIAAFSYDALGRRVRKSVNGTVTQFLYDRENFIQELTDGASPSLKATTLAGFGMDEAFGRTNGTTGAKMEYLTDRLGSTLAISPLYGERSLLRWSAGLRRPRR